MKPLYIFDLDGTLALCDHRSHFVHKCPACNGTAMFAGEDCSCCGGIPWTGKPDWKNFFDACSEDLPNVPVIDTLHALVDSGAEVRIWTGRSSEVMEKTKVWLENNVDACDGIPILMRVEGDFTPDHELKAAWFDQLPAFDKRRLVAVFEDRTKVVEMWRAKGIPCFQVANGDF